MDPRHITLRDGLRAEPLGDEFVVFDRVSGDSVHRVSGEGVGALRAVLGGTDLPAGSDPVVADLIDAGILEDSSGMSRRKVLALGGKALVAGGVVWSAATVTSFKLANPAMAISPCPGGGGENDPTVIHKYTTPGSSGTFKVASSPTPLKVRTWGGGGGGGGGRYNGGWSSGSGGGGGAYAYKEGVVLTACQTYTVVVGAGGSGGAGRNAFGSGTAASNGTAGGDSYFPNASTVMAKGGGPGLGANNSNRAGGTGGQASASIGTTKYNGGNGGQAGANVGQNTGGGGGGGAGAGGAGGNGGDYNGIGGTAGNAGGAAVPGQGGGDSGDGDPVGAGGGGGHGHISNSTAGGSGGRGEVWVFY